jgi:predicted esterase
MIPMRRAVALTAALLAAAAALAEDPPFPAGVSAQELEGLKCTVVMPDEFDVAKERSLVVILHGAGGTDTGMAHSLAHLAKEDFVVLAPKSAGQTWAKSDLDAVKLIVADLKERLNVGERRLHAAGYSNGGWNLAPVALDPDLRFTSACWIAAGFNGGKFPKHAKKEMGVLALAGSKDANRGAAEKTPELARDKVRMAEVRIQKGIGHEWPEEHIPYYGWWMGMLEGRFEPGVTLAFHWHESGAEALAAAKEEKAGAFAYWFSEDDAGNELARTFQNAVLQDRAVRFFGKQSHAWKLDRSEDEEGFAALELKRTPAVVVYDRTGAVKKVLQGKIKAKSLAGALKSVAKTKKLPKR